MKWLLWREYRLNRLILIVGSALLALPYAIALIVAGLLIYWRLPAPLGAGHVLAVFPIAAIYSVVLSQLTLALLGGNAIAGERSDRSAEFLAYLPLSRLRRMASKLSLALAATVVIWGVSLLVISTLVSMTSPESLLDGTLDAFIWFSDYTAVDPGAVAVTGLAFLCVAWLISSVQSSPTFAVAGSLATPLVIFTTLLLAVKVANLQHIPTSLDEIMGAVYAVICLVVAAASFSIGVWCFLRRVASRKGARNLFSAAGRRVDRAIGGLHHRLARDQGRLAMDQRERPPSRRKKHVDARRRRKKHKKGSWHLFVQACMGRKLASGE